jgi:hypothetical protein
VPVAKVFKLHVSGLARLPEGSLQVHGQSQTGYPYWSSQVLPSDICRTPRVSVNFPHSTFIQVTESRCQVVAWVEPAIVAQAVIDVALGEPTTSPALNITHPRPIHWSDMISYVLRALRDHQIVQTTMSLVSFREWYSMLKERNDVSNMSDLV